MLSEEQFRQNVLRWTETHPACPSLSDLTEPHLQFQPNKNGTLNLQKTADGTTTYLHSLDPEKEAAEWFTQLNLGRTKVLIVFGLGLGYYYEAALKWLRSHHDHYLVFLENDLEVIRCLLQTPIGTAMLNDDQVWLSYLDQNSLLALHAIAIVFAPRSYLFSALNFYQVTQSSTLERVEERLDVLMNGRKQILAEYVGSKNFYKNFFRNFFLMPQAYLGNGLFGKFKDVPAIICGAGPSLAHSLPMLETLKNRALIFAGGTAMNAVNNTGFLPHFGIGIDPNEAQFTRLIMNQAFQTPYFYRNRMLHEALHLIQGDRLYISGSNFPLLRWIEDRLQIREEELEGGYNVVNLSLAIARAMGCNPIIFIGVDLAYTDGLSYCPGLLNHPLHEKKKYFRTKSNKDELITRLDVHGKPVSTQIKWVTESLWFTQFASNYPEVILINSSDGGIGFEGIPNIPLDQVAKAWLQQEFDFETLVHEQIQHSPMPKPLNQANISAILTEFLESLQRCYNAAIAARDEFSNVAQGLEGDREAAAQPATNAQTLLLTEPAYQHMLEFYKTIFLELHTLSLRRINNPKHGFSEGEIALQKSLIYQACYEAIAKIAKDNIELLTDLLKQPYPVFEPSHSVTQSPPPVKTELHANGAKTLQKFHLNGSLYSVEHFFNGKLEGKQEYFHPNQQTKTLLNYTQGKLHGAVRLYYADGQPKRELLFEHGQRHGKERIWSATGQLLIEAEFNRNQPCNTARQWDLNGHLIKEVVYSTETEYTIREWDADGALIQEEEGAQSDYFDRAFVLLGQLITQLEQALSQTEALTAVIEKAETKSIEPLENIKIELTADLVKVREVHLHLCQEEEITESIWKSPSSQRHLERQLNELTAKVHLTLKKLQDLLSTTIQAVIKRRVDGSEN